MSTVNRSKSSGQVDVPPEAKPTSEAIRLMKLMEGAMSKYDDPKAEAKVKALMEAMGSNSALTEDEVFLALYDHGYNFDETLKALKEAEADANEADKWTTVEKKKMVDSGDVSPVPSDGAYQRGRRSFNGNARQGSRRGGRQGFRRPFGGRGAPRQRGPRIERGRGRLVSFSSTPVYGQADPVSDVAELVYNDLEEVWDGNLVESQVFTRKFEPSRVSAPEPQCTQTTFSPRSGAPIGQPGSWADLATSSEPPVVAAADQTQDEKEHRVGVRSSLPPVIMPPCSSPVVEGLSFGADYYSPSAMRNASTQSHHLQQQRIHQRLNPASQVVTPQMMQVLKEGHQQPAVFFPYNQQSMLIASQNNAMTALPNGPQSAFHPADSLQAHRNGRTFPHALQGTRVDAYGQRMNGQPMSSTTTTSVMPPHLMSVGTAEQANSSALLDYLTQRLEAAQIQNAFASPKVPSDFPTTAFMSPRMNRVPDTFGRNAWLPENKLDFSSNSLQQESQRTDDNAQMYSLLSQLQGFRSPGQGIFGHDALPRHAFQPAVPRNQQPAAGNSWNL